MAQAFALPRWKILRHVVLPQLAPYLATAARSGLSLIWKIVLVVELLGRPNGVGFGIAFQLFDVTRILAYATAFVAVILAIDTLLVQPLSDARPVGDSGRLEVRIIRKAFVAVSGERVEVLRDVTFGLDRGLIAASCSRW
jgi:Binding-protein-dependent transport system inner membrane component